MTPDEAMTPDEMIVRLRQLDVEQVDVEDEIHRLRLKELKLHREARELEWAIWVAGDGSANP